MMIRTDPEQLRAHIFDALTPEARAIIERLIARTHQAPVYAVGGAVRDAMLGSSASDVDLVVEGDAIATAQAAAEGRRVTVHRRFNTATMKLDGARVDLAMARSETYARPGALPKVAPADIETDLRRRDFTINAMALRLDGEAALLDPTGGLDDLRDRRIRVLHDASFRDDATRIFRAFRYADRLEFDIEARTQELTEDGVRYIETISGERLRYELELLFVELAFDALETCGDAGVLATIHPALGWDLAASQWLHEGKNINVFDVTAYGFGLMAGRASADEAQQITSRLRLKRNEAAAVAGVAALREAAPLLSRPNAKPSGAVQILERYTDAAIGAFGGINGGNAAGAIAQQYLTEWQFVKPALTARDLMALGVPEGPRISQALQLLRAARLDETAFDADDERRLVARFVAAIRDSSGMNAPLELHANGH